MSSVKSRLRREWRVLRAILCFSARGVSIGKRPVMEYQSIRLENEGMTSVGERAVFSNAESRSLLRTVGSGFLEIGDRVFINAGVTIVAVNSVRIGNDVKIGANVAISDTGSHELVAGIGVKVAPIHIGDNVWIGRGAFIMPGVSIGANAIIAAGAIVNVDVPSDTVVAGVPARVVKTLPPSHGARR